MMTKAEVKKLVRELQFAPYRKKCEARSLLKAAGISSTWRTWHYVLIQNDEVSDKVIATYEVKDAHLSNWNWRL